MKPVDRLRRTRMPEGHRGMLSMVTLNTVPSFPRRATLAFHSAPAARVRFTVEALALGRQGQTKETGDERLPVPFVVGKSHD